MSGPHTNDLVLLVHGGAAGQSPLAETSASWRPVVAGLEARGFRVLALDRPGHGARTASSLDDLSYERDVAAAAAAIAAHGGAAHVVGHAEGGITALLLAQRDVQQRHGVTVRSCTVIGGFGAEPTADAPNRVLLADPPGEPWSPASQRWALRRLTYSGTTCGARCDDDVAAASARAAAAILAAPGARARIAGDLLKAKSQIFAYARDHAYDVPISLTFGMSDPLSEPPRAVELMKLLASTTAHLELNLVDRAGHFVQFERHDECLRILSGFLSLAVAA